MECKAYGAFSTSGYTQSHLDYSLFIKSKETTLVIILVYVDDLLITGSNSSLIQETKQVLHHHFKIKDLRELRYFLGLNSVDQSKQLL